MISLLWPFGGQPRGGRAAWADDLALEPIVQALSLHSRYAGVARATLTALSADAATIGFRQDLLADLERLPELAAGLEAALPALSGAAAAGAQRWAGEQGVFQIASQVDELEAYVEAIRALLAALGAARPGLRAQGWLSLADELAATAATDEFRALEAELPALRAQLERARSVTLGINLDEQLRPESATLLRVSAERFGGQRPLLSRLLGGDGEQGRTPLRQAGERQAFGPDRRLFLDLSQLLEDVTAPVAAALARLGRSHGAALATLEGEIGYYLGAARLARALRAEGYALCRPAIAPPDERVCVARGLYNLELALRLRARREGAAPAAPVPNDAAFDEAGRIFVLTGPNRGGKTTFTRAVGLAQALAQAGLPVPAEEARVSPADAIFTLFPAAETAQTGMGRLDEEAAQLAAIFRGATRRSLVLLNEPLGSTSPYEAVAIARDVLAGLRLLGARGLLVTHLHELAGEAAALNGAVAGASAVATLVAEVAPQAGAEAGGARTYRISRGLPDGRSYAADIAVAHGLHLSQIERTLRERGL